MRTTPLEDRIIALCTPVAAGMGLEIVCVNIIGEGGSRNVQIMAENPETGNLTLEQCAELSRSLSVLLDVEDPIEGAYRLEVSSPGIDRPLLRMKDFERFKGFEVKLEMSIPAENGQKRFRGVIAAIGDDTITLQTDQGPAHIAFDALSKARLVMNDHLLKATAASRRA